MRYWYDAEFLEDGRTIELMSIGIVSQDGRGYYAVNAGMPETRIRENAWLMENVVPGLTHRRDDQPADWLYDHLAPAVKPHSYIAREVMEFLLHPSPFGHDDEGTELWADYGAYDHVVLAQLFGKMIDLPPGIPMFTNELQQEIRRVGLSPADLPKQETGLHNALADAIHNKRLYNIVMAADAKFRLGNGIQITHSQSSLYPHVNVTVDSHTLLNGYVLPDYLEDKFPSLLDGLTYPANPLLEEKP